MITILEEEDYGSFDSNQGTSNPRNENRSKGHFNQSEDSLNVDTVEDQEKMTTESLQRQDSIKNWLEFKSEEVKRDSFGKAQKNPNIEIFPTVIKGLDLESSHHKSVSLGDVQQKSSFTRKDSGLSRGGSLGSDSNKANLSRNEVLNDKDTDKYERLSDYEDVNGRSSMSLDESMMSNLSNFNMPGNFNKQPPAGEVYDALNKIIESKNCEDPEKLLFSVIGKEPLEMFDHPKSFWEKLRRKENKYRENQWHNLALDEWAKTDGFHKEIKKENVTLNYEIAKYDREAAVVSHETNTLEESIYYLKKNTIDHKAKSELKLEAKNSEIDEAYRCQEFLLQKLQETRDSYSQKDLEEDEREERWKMRIEDLRSQLTSIMDERIQAEQECLKNQGFLEKMESEHDLQNFQNEQIELCLDLLNESMNFFTKSKEHLNFTTEFCEVLKSLKNATFEAIEAEKEFKRDALTDPRSIMPYSRQSEFLPGTSSRFVNSRFKFPN